MKPSVTILDYLYSARNSWFRCSEECNCPIEKRIENFLDELSVEVYAEVVVIDDRAELHLTYLDEEEWDNIIGPKAQDELLQEQVNAYLSAASEIMALQASKERLSGE